MRLKPTAEEALAVAMEELLKHCVEARYEAPFLVFANSTNGAFMCCRYAREKGGMLQPKMAASEGDKFSLPMNLFATDALGQSAHLMVQNDGSRSSVVRLGEGGA